MKRIEDLPTLRIEPTRDVRCLSKDAPTMGMPAIRWPRPSLPTASGSSGAA